MKLHFFVSHFCSFRFVISGFLNGDPNPNFVDNNYPHSTCVKILFCNKSGTVIWDFAIVEYYNYMYIDYLNGF